jgi:type IV secretion system protein VirB1
MMVSIFRYKRVACTIVFLLVSIRARTEKVHLPTEFMSELNTKLTLSEVEALSHRCAPLVDPEIMIAIARTESALHPYAVSINYPMHTAEQHGYQGKVIMLRQPKNKTEAIHWAEWYMNQGYTISVGLVQVNIQMAKQLGVKPMALFEPCLNLAAGAKILREDLAALPKSRQGLIRAFSLYNSGSLSLGAANGYASTVMKNTK